MKYKECTKYKGPTSVLVIILAILVLLTMLLYDLWECAKVRTKDSIGKITRDLIKPHRCTPTPSSTAPQICSLHKVIAAER